MQECPAAHLGVGAPPLLLQQLALEAGHAEVRAEAARLRLRAGRRRLRLLADLHDGRDVETMTIR